MNFRMRLGNERRSTKNSRSDLLSSQIYISTSSQAQFDKLKRKALFAPTAGNENNHGLMANVLSNPLLEDQRPRPRVPAGNSSVPHTRDVPLAPGMDVNRVSHVLLGTPFATQLEFQS